jgi:hypothetical protein
MFKNYSRTHEVFNHKFYEINGVKTYFQSVGGLVDAAKVVRQNLLRTMFENRCDFKNNIYVPNIFFGAAFAANALNHDYFPGAYSLNDLKLNVDSVNTNIGTINSNLSHTHSHTKAKPYACVSHWDNLFMTRGTCATVHPCMCMTHAPGLYAWAC